jgi:antitoxin YefM
MNKLTATDARRDFFDIVRGATQKHQVYRIQHRNGSVVLLSEEEYDNLIETLELLSIKGFRESIERSVDQIKRGETVSFEEVFGAD